MPLRREFEQDPLEPEVPPPGAEPVPTPEPTPPDPLRTHVSAPAAPERRVTLGAGAHCLVCRYLVPPALVAFAALLIAALQTIESWDPERDAALARLLAEPDRRVVAGPAPIVDRDRAADLDFKPAEDRLAPRPPPPLDDDPAPPRNPLVADRPPGPGDLPPAFDALERAERAFAVGGPPVAPPPVDPRGDRNRVAPPDIPDIGADDDRALAMAPPAPDALAPPRDPNPNANANRQPAPADDKNLDDFLMPDPARDPRLREPLPVAPPPRDAPDPGRPDAVIAVRRPDLGGASRAQYRAALRRVLELEGQTEDQLAATIRSVGVQYRVGVTESARAKLRSAIELGSLARRSVPAQVRALREMGIPEPMILDFLASYQLREVGSRNGPRTQSEAWIKSARRLLAMSPDE